MLSSSHGSNHGQEHSENQRLQLHFIVRTRVTSDVHASRLFLFAATSLLVFGVLQAGYLFYLWTTLPNMELLAIGPSEAELLARADEIHRALTAWQAHAIGTSYFSWLLDLARDYLTLSFSDRVLSFNKGVQSGYHYAHAGMTGSSIVACMWIVGSTVAFMRRRFATAGSAVALLGTLLMTPVLSEPLLGADLSHVFLRWQLPGLVLSFLMLLAAPRPVPWVVRLSRFVGTRSGAVIGAVALFVLGGVIAAASVAVSRGLGRGVVVFAVGPFVLGFRLLIRAFSRRTVGPSP